MANYDLGNLQILVVDDNHHMRVLVKNVLNALGVTRIAEAEDGSDALKILQSFDADLAIVDWQMEPLDGMDFVRTLRTSSDSANKFLPVIMLTAYSEISRVLEARDTGVNEFLAKPISATTLYSRIKSIIDNPRPFVKSGMFFGPDRRRRDDPAFGGDERRATA